MVVHDFVGGDRRDPFTGVFRLGPDLPLRQDEKGFAAFPYPGYSILYAPNLTRFGLGGDHSGVSLDNLVLAIRHGVDPTPDEYGRVTTLNHVMLWQFYSSMTDDDAYSIAEYLKSLRYEIHDVIPITDFGTDWAAAFEYAFGTAPSNHDREIFGMK